MTHTQFMHQALALARESLAAGEIPVGCVIVKDGTVVGTGRNRREADRDPLGHAELEAIRNACRTLGTWRLEGCTLYVTLEPCPMCAGAILQSRIPHVVFGAFDPTAGCMGSVLALQCENFDSRPQVLGGVEEDICRELLSSFFARLRRES